MTELMKGLTWSRILTEKTGQEESFNIEIATRGENKDWKSQKPPENQSK